MNRTTSVFTLLFSLALLSACQTPAEETVSATADEQESAGRSSSADGATLYIISPMDGEETGGSVTVRFGLSGMGVAPAGTVKDNTGHHHLLIDVEELPSFEFPIPNDANHRHFGGGQTQVSIDLEPGTHTLQLVLGDQSHVPHDPPLVSEKITITIN
jgi:hypothetical protein